MEIQFNYQDENGVEVSVVAELDHMERAVVMASLLPLLTETIDQTLSMLLGDVDDEDDSPEGSALSGVEIRETGAVGRAVWGNH
jgi:hypothetical protein